MVWPDELNYIIASATVAILMFFLCFVMGCVFYNCSAIYRSFGYERIPKYELERRKHLAKMASLHSSQQYLAPVHTIEKDSVSWVQKWQDGGVEEKDAVMQLGPEVPEAEYQIETTLEDITPIDLTTSEGNGIVVPDGLYATVDKSRPSSIHTIQNGEVVRDSTDVL